ncbi:transporter substrate-binding domain-containing protein [Pseudodesulfovibrio sp. zrk46]|uniref:transporter substrate-binding domain-containing protein n=1 Tax=Pseudodesulfovibrio sp. zrk46 TaxID=2725288 RepID=UPI001449B2E0|nr:transporter substrate-binding domain-containing protein [Pseudodesulfovibrio sp. zrk46]QJB57013.1 transporter substrate-binding domain-containing protein [Pseudodesulfovibrio sp. zrk46]
MKKTLHILLAVSICFITLASDSNAQSAPPDNVSAPAPKSLKLGMTSNDASIVSLKVLEAAYATIGIKIIPVPLPGLRALDESNQGFLDGEVCRIQEIEKDNPNLIRIPEPVDSFTIIAVTVDPDTTVKTLADIKQLRIGTRSGVKFADSLTVNCTKVTALPDWDTLFDLLVLGRLDVLLTTLHSLKTQTQRLRNQYDFKHTVLLDKPLFHYLHKKNKHLVPAISKLLKESNENGKADAIRHQTKIELEPLN